MNSPTMCEMYGKIELLKEQNKELLEEVIKLKVYIKQLETIER